MVCLPRLYFAFNFHNNATMNGTLYLKVQRILFFSECNNLLFMSWYTCSHRLLLAPHICIVANCYNVDLNHVIILNHVWLDLISILLAVCIRILHPLRKTTRMSYQFMIRNLAIVKHPLMRNIDTKIRTVLKGMLHLFREILLQAPIKI